MRGQLSAVSEWVEGAQRVKVALSRTASFLIASKFQPKEELLGKSEVLLLTVGNFKVQLVKTFILFYAVVILLFCITA